MTDKPVPQSIMRDAANVFWDIAAQAPTTGQDGEPCWSVKVGREIIARSLMAERERAWKDGFLGGFAASAEGYNGEYPFDDDGSSPLDDEKWVENRDRLYAEAAAIRLEDE